MIAFLSLEKAFILTIPFPICDKELCTPFEKGHFIPIFQSQTTSSLKSFLYNPANFLLNDSIHLPEHMVSQNRSPQSEQSLLWKSQNYMTFFIPTQGDNQLFLTFFWYQNSRRICIHCCVVSFCLNLKWRNLQVYDIPLWVGCTEVGMFT
jgi:hypothetical protein